MSEPETGVEAAEITIDFQEKLLEQQKQHLFSGKLAIEESYTEQLNDLRHKQFDLELQIKQIKLEINEINKEKRKEINDHTKFMEKSIKDFEQAMALNRKHYQDKKMGGFDDDETSNVKVL
tara:strand:+ start:229 stop:591 length:363 start_codon:yes stop_codon:yes gene_type:complete